MVGGLNTAFEESGRQMEGGNEAVPIAQALEIPGVPIGILPIQEVEYAAPGLKPAGDHSCLVRHVLVVVDPHVAIPAELAPETAGEARYQTRGPVRRDGMQVDQIVKMRLEQRVARAPHVVWEAVRYGEHPQRLAGHVDPIHPEGLRVPRLRSEAAQGAEIPPYQIRYSLADERLKEKGPDAEVEQGRP
jgi:hypothetical protein